MEETGTACVTQEAAAARWWASRLGNATHDVGMGNASEMDLTIMLNLDTVRGSRTQAEQERFRAALEAVIGEHLRECATCGNPGGGVYHKVRVDYDPDDLLFAAAERAGIDMHSRELPAKTYMIFRDGEVIVSEGYGAPYETIWAGLWQREEVNPIECTQVPRERW
jgi:hypothetical protein